MICLLPSFIHSIHSLPNQLFFKQEIDSKCKHNDLNERALVLGSYLFYKENSIATSKYNQAEHDKHHLVHKTENSEVIKNPRSTPAEI